MREIYLQNIPNQSLSFNAGETFWQIELKATPSGVAASVFVDGDEIVSCMRVLEREMILPFNYMMPKGNLVVYTGGEDVDWEKFGVTQSLIFLEVGEI